MTFLTFSESKQAITLPFSTWQLFGGCANLHSSSLREQVPLWNWRHTSNVSHFVSLIEDIFKAMSRVLNLVNVQNLLTVFHGPTTPCQKSVQTFDLWFWKVLKSYSNQYHLRGNLNWSAGFTHQSTSTNGRPLARERTLLCGTFKWLFLHRHYP